MNYRNAPKVGLGTDKLSPYRMASRHGDRHPTSTKLPPWGQTNYRFLPRSRPVDYAPSIADQPIVQFILDTIPQTKNAFQTKSSAWGQTDYQRPHGDRQIISKAESRNSKSRNRDTPSPRIPSLHRSVHRGFHRGQTDYPIFFGNPASSFLPVLDEMTIGKPT